VNREEDKKEKTSGRPLLMCRKARGGARACSRAVIGSPITKYIEYTE
jgi:hypothetical protein